MKKMLVLFVLIATFVLLNAEYVELQKIFSDDGDEFDRFAESVGISGDFLICGAWSNDGGGAAQGAAYVFYNNAGTWEQHSKFTVAEAEDYDKFGTSTCISGDFAVMTSVNNTWETKKGAAAIFYYNSDTNAWEQQIFIEKPELPNEAMFGYSSAIDGNNAIIGMRPFDADVGLPGAGFIYNYDGTTWTETAEIVPQDAIPGDAVGNCVAIYGDYAIVSAHGTDFPADDEGAAYIYKNIGGTWTEMQVLNSSDPQIDAYFGAYVDINDNYAVIGALVEDINGSTDQGAVYVFENNGDIWTQSQKITAYDGEAGDTFGSDFDFNENLLIIGARGNGANGAVYVYENIGGTWTFSEKIEPTDGTGNDVYGDAIALQDDTFIVGSQWHNTNGTEKAGAAYIYSAQNQSVEIEVNPEEFVLEMNSNEIFTDQFTITNIGSGTVYCIIAVSATEPWLTADPDYCEIAEDGSEIIDVTFDTTNLIAGTYQSQIYVIYERNELEIPVTLTVTGTDANENTVSSVTKLIGNYPNPFNPTTTISFNLTAEDAKNAKLGIYNLKGQKIKTFCYPELVEGSITWNGTDENNKTVSSGMYFYKLQAGNYSQTKKMILMK